MFIYRGFSCIFITHKSGCLFFGVKDTQTGSPWTWPRIAKNTRTHIQELGLKCMRMCVEWMWFLFLSLCRFIFFFRWIFFSSSVFRFLYFHFIFSPSFSFDDYFPDSIFKCACMCVCYSFPFILLRISFSLFTVFILSFSVYFWIGDFWPVNTFMQSIVKNMFVA